MITVFDMASGDAMQIALVEPEVDMPTAVSPQQDFGPQVALRLMTVAEAVEMERRSR